MSPQPMSQNPCTTAETPHVRDQDAQSEINIALRTQNHDHQPPATEAPSPSAANPQFLQRYADNWASQQSLEREYTTYKDRSIKTIDLVAEHAVADMSLSRFEFVQSTATPANNGPSPSNEGGGETLLNLDSAPEDLSYCLRNFVVVNPVDDPSAVFARISVKGGYAMPGYVPPLPRSNTRECPRGEAEATEVDSERETCGSY